MNSIVACAFRGYYWQFRMSLRSRDATPACRDSAPSSRQTESRAKRTLEQPRSKQVSPWECGVASPPRAPEVNATVARGRAEPYDFAFMLSVCGSKGAPPWSPKAFRCGLRTQKSPSERGPSEARAAGAVIHGPGGFLPGRWVTAG